MLLLRGFQCVWGLCRDMNVGSGYYAELAYNTGALQVWVEHRYYADSAPYLPADDFEHLTVEQAMVDHVEVVLHVQRVLSMDRAPVIAIGGSYSELHLRKLLHIN